MKIIELEKIDSTNNYAKEYLKNNILEEELIIFTNFQESGRGNGTNSWHSEKSKNLLFSIIAKPLITPEEYFKINMSVTLSIYKYLKIKNIDVKIKWSNDIYFENKKLCGILIENIIIGNLLTYTIIGIGLNVNETKFPKKLPNPISMMEIKKCEYNLKEELYFLSKIIINNLKNDSIITIQELKKEFISVLYQFGKFYKYKTQGSIFWGKIIDVEDLGNLVIETQTSEIKTFAYKEVEFI